jgi:hypothetical protein
VWVCRVFRTLSEDVVPGFFTPDPWARDVTIKVLDALTRREFPALFVHCGCAAGLPRRGPGADVAGVSPVPVRMCQG